MGLLSFFQTSLRKEWIIIYKMEQLAEISIKSNTKSQIIFKHSTTCSISRMAQGRMQQGLSGLLNLADVYYLDLLANRNISNAIAEKWNVNHESPQIIIVKHDKAIYNASHGEININEIEEKLS